MESHPQMLDEKAVYRRTLKGGGELLAPSRSLSRTELRFVGLVDGFTSVRVLLDMGLNAADLQQAITKLLRLGLIEQATDLDSDG